MSPRKKKVTPRISPKARRELDEIAKQILSGEAEALERFLMRQLYGKPTETDVDPVPLKPMADTDGSIDQEPGT